MLGALIGDTVGSIYEFNNIHTTDFPLFSPSSTFTDDSVMTMAIAHALLGCGAEPVTAGSCAVQSMQKFGRTWPHAGYGGRFIQWLFDETMGPYNSLSWR